MDLVIVANSVEYYDESIRIFNEAFLPKFRFVSDREDLQRSFVHDFGLIDLDVKDKEFLALVDGKVVGIISLIYKDLGKLKGRPNLSYRELWQKYGLMGIIKASILGRLTAYLPPRSELYINSIGILEDARGKGIGTELMNFAENFAKETGHTNLSLHVMKENGKAKALYQRLGFVIIKDKSFKWLEKKTGYSGAYFMIKPI